MTAVSFVSDPQWYQLYLPMAGIQVVWPGLLLLGLALGFVSGHWKVGGAWLLTPGLNALGMPMSFAVGTSLCVLVGSCLPLLREKLPTSKSHPRQTFVLLCGALAGVELGARVLFMFESSGLSGPILRWTYEILLGLVLGFILFSPRWLCGVLAEKARLQYRIRGDSGIRISPQIYPAGREGADSTWLLLVVGLLSGCVFGCLGIGYGLLQLPLFMMLPGSTVVVAMARELLVETGAGVFALLTFTLKGRVDLLALLLLVPVTLVGIRLGRTALDIYSSRLQRLLLGLTVLGMLGSVILKQEEQGELAVILCVVTSAMVCVPLVLTVLYSLVPVYAFLKRKRP